MATSPRDRGGDGDIAEVFGGRSEKEFKAVRQIISIGIVEEILEIEGCFPCKRRILPGVVGQCH